MLLRPKIYHWFIILLFISWVISAFLLLYTSDQESHRQRAYQHIAVEIEQKLLDQKASLGAFGSLPPKIIPQSFPDPSFILLYYQHGKLKFWSDYLYIPAYTELSGDYELRTFDTGDAIFIARKKSSSNDTSTAELYSLLLLKRKFQVENNYISSGINENVLPYGNNLDISLNPNDGFPISFEGDYLFSVVLAQDFTENRQVYHQISFIFAILGFISLLLSIFYFFKSLLRERSFVFVSLLLALVLITLRLLLAFVSLPNSLWETALFSPRNYYENFINSSLGHIFLNYALLLFFVWFLLVNLRKARIFLQLKNLTTPAKVLIGTLLTFLGVYSLSAQHFLVMKITQYSQITLDISQSYDIDTLRIFAFLLILFSAVIFFITNHLVMIILSKNRLTTSTLILLLVIGYTIFLVAFWEEKFTLWHILFHILFVVSMYFSGWVFSLNRIRYISYLYFFSSAIISSLVFALAIYESEEYTVRINKEKFANHLLIENDILAEYLLSEAVKNIQKDVQLASRFINQKLITTQLFDRIKLMYFHTYLDKYEPEMLFFDEDGYLIAQSGGAEVGHLEELKARYSKPEFATEYANIFFVNDAAHFDLSRYYVFIPMERYNTSLGYLVVVLQLKMYMPSSVYPELLVDKRFIFTPDESFDYAMYRDGNFAYEVGDFNYLVDFDKAYLNNPIFYTKGILDENGHHLGVRSSDDKVFVITSPIYPVNAILSNFSFMFQLLLLLIVLLSMINAINLQFKEVQLNFATRLQIYLSLAMFLPLLFISIAILNSLNKSYNDETEKGYSKKADHTGRNLVSAFKDFSTNKINREQFSETVSDVSRHAQIDINIYDEKGKLIVTSQPLVFESNIFSSYINPKPFQQIMAGEEEAITYDERIGTLGYRTTYRAIRSFEEGKLLGVLSIPFFQSKSYLQKQQLEVFNSIINIVTFIFLASFILTNLATTVITRPLNLIAQKLRKTKLEGENHPLVWNSNDEIGILVIEYNKMLRNLAKSKEYLSQTEKEMAWREMARQVAHEIKNPLTPMKLTLQHLQRTLRIPGENSNEAARDFDRPIKTLLEQIDTLSEIATSFSAFAQMPIPENQVVDLGEIVKNALQLFSEECEIKHKIPTEKLMVFADPKLIGRILNNLLLNGIQSVPEGVVPRLFVTVSKTAEMVKVAVQDNGTGIDAGIAKKIFTPNFSTKSSGSGLGLAISKRGLENAGGKIWFASEIGVGTVFFFELPLVDG